MDDVYHAKLSKNARKDLKKLPLHILLKLQAWIEDVGHLGLSEIRKIPGYHDESLKGKRVGQRSIRLSRGYRAIYIIDEDESIRFLEIIEVNHHEY
jgi:toxin HigB-1